MKDRLTVLSTVHHEAMGEEPTTVDTGFSCLLKDNDQPFVRRIYVREDWAPLDHWVERPGFIVLQNKEGVVQLTNLSDEEKAELATKVIRVGHPDFPSLEFEMGPGEAFGPVKIKEGSQLFVCCDGGRAKMYAYVFPR